MTALIPQIRIITSINLSPASAHQGRWGFKEGVVWLLAGMT